MYDQSMQKLRLASFVLAISIPTTVLAGGLGDTALRDGAVSNMANNRAMVPCPRLNQDVPASLAAEMDCSSGSAQPAVAGERVSNSPFSGLFRGHRIGSAPPANADDDEVVVTPVSNTPTDPSSPSDDDPSNPPSDDGPSDPPSDDGPSDPPSDDGPSDPPSDDGPSNPPSDDGPSDPPSDDGPSDPPSDDGPSDPPSDDGPSDPPSDDDTPPPPSDDDTPTPPKDGGKKDKKHKDKKHKDKKTEKKSH